MLIPFLSGAVVLGFWAAGLFFLRAYRNIGDELFLAFTAAFWLLGLTQALLAFSTATVEERSWVYLLRLGAFVIILVAIWRKNRKALR